MPTTAPPFPATGNPHLDIELRELYRRVVEAEERVSVIPGTTGPSPDLGLVKIIEATPVKLFQAFVDFDRGWFNDDSGSLPSSGPAVVLGNPRPPFVVLQVFVTCDVVFSHPVAAYGFGIGTTFAYPPVDHREYYASTAYPMYLLSYRGAEPTLDFTQSLGGDQKFKAVRVVQTAPPTQIVAGFIQANRRIEQWPSGMEGRLHVMVLYADTPQPELVPLSRLQDKTLLSALAPSSP